ncbi:sensor domain-containing protein [Amycolatopsis pithecellobii]|uniref:Two-component system sensor kinase n=1 Tax=Amycolatopsis pithecellobii TaxID=664692 RepID=A0A6N7YVU3_9PSEU|nr:sensor domain-containing protein [Amycolatopsis pithecellobii]MTD57197.1 two-component system sensor kinase [Amycolatopsis pithecellobii]
MHTIQDGTRPRPPVAGSLGYLLLNLPVGIAGFVAVVTLAAVGLGTAVVWAGVPVLALLLLGTRAAARFERARAHALLGTYIATPYRPLPATGWRARWRARLLDGATWRDLGYFVLLFPVATAEFVILVTCWSAGLALTALPIYAPADSDLFGAPVQTLPWAAVGLLVLALSRTVTRAMGAAHARFVRLVLGPGPRARRLAESESDSLAPVA